jgi:hypothetical protein
MDEKERRNKLLTLGGSHFGLGEELASKIHALP